MTPMVLLIDNYDSFTYNLVHLLEELGAEVVVRLSDEVSAPEAAALAPDRASREPHADQFDGGPRFRLRHPR